MRRVTKIKSLRTDQTGIYAAFYGDETFKVARLDNLALFEHYTTICVLDGGQPVGDRNCCSAFGCLFQGSLYDALATYIYGTGGFVKYEDGGLLYDGSGNGNALTLSAGEPGTALACIGVISLEQNVSRGQARNFCGQTRGSLSINSSANASWQASLTRCLFFSSGAALEPPRENPSSHERRFRIQYR